MKINLLVNKNSAEMLISVLEARIVSQAYIFLTPGVG